MKNKKSLLSLGLLALVLVLGVGYAVVSSIDLTFNGTAEGIADSELKVTIENVEDTKTAAEVEHSIDAARHSDKFTITGMTLNETVKMVYTIKNNETDVDANLVEKIVLSNDNEEYFNVDYTIDGSTINAGDSTTVTVNVTMVKTPVVAEKNKATISFTLSANPVNNAD